MMDADPVLVFIFFMAGMLAIAIFTSEHHASF